MSDRPLVLFVEDEETFRGFASRYLEENGFEVVQTGSGAEALTAVPQRDPSLVLLDLNLPDSHGLEILGKIRQANPDQRRQIA